MYIIYIYIVHIYIHSTIVFCFKKGGTRKHLATWRNRRMETYPVLFWLAFLKLFLHLESFMLINGTITIQNR